MDLVGIEPTTSSMPWRRPCSRYLVFKHLATGTSGRNGRIRRYFRPISGQISTLKNWGCRGGDMLLRVSSSPPSKQSTYRFLLGFRLWFNLVHEALSSSFPSQASSPTLSVPLAFRAKVLASKYPSSPSESHDEAVSRTAFGFSPLALTVDLNPSPSEFPDSPFLRFARFKLPG